MSTYVYIYIYICMCVCVCINNCLYIYMNILIVKIITIIKNMVFYSFIMSVCLSAIFVCILDYIYQLSFVVVHTSELRGFTVNTR